MTEVSENSHRVLELAQEVYDKHVEEGLQKKDTIIEEAKQEAATIISGATQDLHQLNQELEKLKEFEALYRARLETLVSYAHESLQVTETGLILMNEDESTSSPAELDLNTEHIEIQEPIVEENEATIIEETTDPIEEEINNFAQ